MAAQLLDAPFLQQGTNASPAPPAAPPQAPELPDAPWASPAPTAAHGPLEAIQAGWQGSAVGLAWRGKLPDLVLDPQNSKWWERALAGTTQVGAELPLMVAGSAAGTAAGTAVGGPVGGTLGAGAGMFAVPAAIRETLIQAYRSGDIKTAGEFFTALKDVAEKTLKEGAIGAATFGVGSVAARTVGKALLPAVGQSITVGTATKAISAADTLAQIATMTTVPAALEGHMPHAQDFVDAAIVIGGLKAAHTISAKLMSIYARTGKPPAEVAAEAKADPELAKELVTVGPEAPAAAPASPLEQSPVYQSIYEQLRATGRGTPEQADAEAKLQAAFIRTMAQRTGTTEERLFAERGATVTGKPLGAAEAQTQGPAEPQTEAADLERRANFLRTVADEIRTDTPDQAKNLEDEATTLGERAAELRQAPPGSGPGIAYSQSPTARPTDLPLEHPEMREILQGMADNELGWAQIGGRHAGGQMGVPNFTKWIPRAEWWMGRPDKAMNEPKMREAVRKALAGEKLRPAEQRAVDFMREVANDRLAASKDMGEERFQLASEELVKQRAEPTTANVVDTDAVARANERDADAVERAAMRYADNDAAFMREIMRINSDLETSDATAGGGEGTPAPREPTAGAARERAPEIVRRTVAGGNPADGWTDATRIRRAGGPLEVYRGADVPLDAQHFADESLGHASGNASAGLGAWFTPSRSEAATYGRPESFFLDIRNPKVIKVEELPGFESVQDAIAYREAAKAEGYDGLVISAKHLGGKTHVVAFSPEQVIRTENQAAYFQDAKPTFYSALGRRIDESKMKEAPAQSWKDYVRGLASKGVKPDEVKWSGLEDWLDLQQGKVSKEAVQEFLRNNGVQVTEEMKGGPGERTLDAPEIRGVVERLRAESIILDQSPDGRHWAVVDMRPDSPFEGELFTDPGELKQLFGEDNFTIERMAEGWRVWLKPEKMYQIVEPDGTRIARFYATEQDARSDIEAMTGRSFGRTGARVELVQTESSRIAGTLPRDLTEEQAAGEARVQFGEALKIPESEQQNYRDAADALNYMNGAAAEVQTKFGGYVLPGGEEYRELLLTLPARKPQPPRALEVWPSANGDGYAVWEGSQQISTGAMSRNDATLLQSQWMRENRATRETFTAGHWDEPNVLAHVRFNERTDAEGTRTLFLEEIQSDWAQKGKRQGFTREPDALELEVQTLTGLPWQTLTGLPWREVSASRIARAGGTEELQNRWMRHLENLPPERNGQIPAAPFVGKTEAWVALTLKRMIRYAAENGMDRVAWTTGEQQVERWTGALRKHVDAIEWKKTPEGVQLIGYNGRADYNADQREPRIKVVDTTEKETTLSDAIGKTMAKQILEDPNQTGTIEGENIRVDDTGMASFYDRIVPNVANDVLKKLGGGKVKQVAVQRGDQYEPPALERFTAEDWQTFGGAENFPNAADPIIGETRLIRDGEPIDVTVAVDRAGIHLVLPRDQYVRVEWEDAGWQGGDGPKNPRQAQDFLDHEWVDPGSRFWAAVERVEGLDFEPVRTLGESTQPGFDITPEMKAKALEGQPLFQRGDRGMRGYMAPDTRTIGILAGADKSTFIHESGHYFLETATELAAEPNAPADLKADMGTALKALGVPDLETWRKMNVEERRPFHEAFADLFTQYVAEGRAPSSALAGAFERFKAWLIEVYQAFTRAGQKVSPEVRAVMDRMLATDEEIRQGTPAAYAQNAVDAKARAIVPGVEAGKVADNPFADQLPQAPGEPSLPAHVNYNRINGTLEAKLALTRLSEEYESRIQTQRRGTVTNEQTSAEAARLLADTLGGVDARLVAPREPGTAAGAAEILARKALVEGAIADMMRVGDAYRAKGRTASADETIEYLASIERTSLITSEFLGARAEVGRALQILKTTMDAAERSKQIQQVIEMYGGEPTKLAEMMKEIETPSGAVKFARDTAAVSNAAGKLIEDVTSVLEANAGDPQKLDRELQALQDRRQARPQSDMRRLGVQAVRDVIAKNRRNPEKLKAIMDQLKTPEGARAFAEDQLKPTLWEKLIEGWKAGILSGPVTHMANLTGNTSFAFMRPVIDQVAAVIGAARGASVGERLSMWEPLGRMVGFFEGTRDGLKLGVQAMLHEDSVDISKGESYRHAIQGKKGQIIRLPFRALSAEDRVFSTMNERGELYSMATNQAVREGLSPLTHEFRDRVAQIVQNPSVDMVEASIAAGKRFTFNVPLGEKGRAVQNLVRAWHLEWAVPFIRTPANIALELGRMSPLAPLVSDWSAAFREGGIARDRAIAELAVGTGIMALTVGYAFQGKISGNGPPEPGRKRVQRAAGWQPYSIEIDGKWYSYSRIQPVGTLLGLAADMSEIWDHMTPDEQAQVPKMVSIAFANAVTNQTFLQGITMIVNGMSDPTRFMPRMIQQLTASAVPNIIAQPESMRDPYSRSVNSVLDAVRARIPGARETLPPRIDVWGTEVPSWERVGVVFPSTVTEQSTDKVKTEAVRLGIAAPGTPQKLHIGRGTGKYGEVEITPQQQEKFDRVSGTVARSILEPLVNTPAWDSLPELVKRRAYAHAFLIGNRMAAFEALPPADRIPILNEITQRITQELVPLEPKQ